MTVSIKDVSARSKVGAKGPQAAAWLASHGIEVPQGPNTWLTLPGGGLVARLAETEFFLEGDGLGGLASLLEQSSPGVYPVPRQDVCFELAGPSIHQVLRQTCSIDFQAKHSPGALFMTSMIGVSVLVIQDDAPAIRIWADPTFGPYLWNTFSKIVQDLKGGTQ